MATLLERTKVLLSAVTDGEGGISLRQIARESGGTIEYDWLKRFASGDIADPSVNRIQVLHDFLTSRKPLNGAAA